MSDQSPEEISRAVALRGDDRLDETILPFARTSFAYDSVRHEKSGMTTKAIPEAKLSKRIADAMKATQLHVFPAVLIENEPFCEPKPFDGR